MKGYRSKLTRQLSEMSLLPCPVLHVLNLECRFIGYAQEPLVLHLPSLENLVFVSTDTHVVLSKRTCPREVHLFAAHELDLNFGDVPAFVAGINLLGYTACEILTVSTQLLLEHFDDPELWQKSSEPGVRSSSHKICRQRDRLAT